MSILPPPDLTPTAYEHEYVKQHQLTIYVTSTEQPAIGRLRSVEAYVPAFLACAMLDNGIFTA